MSGVINHKSAESGSEVIKTTNAELKLVTSPFDLIIVDLYKSEDKYHVINQPYWLKNSKGEYEKYEMYFHFDGDEDPTLIRTWRELKRFVNNKMMYICR